MKPSIAAATLVGLIGALGGSSGERTSDPKKVRLTSSIANAQKVPDAVANETVVAPAGRVNCWVNWVYEVAVAALRLNVWLPTLALNEAPAPGEYTSYQNEKLYLPAAVATVWE